MQYGGLSIPLLVCYQPSMAVTGGWCHGWSHLLTQALGKAAERNGMPQDGHGWPVADGKKDGWPEDSWSYWPIE